MRSLLAAPIVVGGGWALLRTLPDLVRDEIAARIKARTGLEAKLGDVSVGLGSIEIGELSCGAAPGPRLSARAIVVDANAFLLAFRGSAAVDAVRIGKLSIALPIGAKSTSELLAKLRSSGGASGGGARSSALEKLAVDELQIDASDAQGMLAAVRGARIAREGEELTASAKSVVLGDAKVGEELRISGVTSSLRSADGALRVTQLVVARLEMIARTATPSAAPAVEPEDDGAEEDEGAGGEATDEAAAVKEPEAPPTLFTRLLAARDALKPATKTEGAEPGSGEAIGKGSSRLAPGAVLRLDDGVMLSSPGGAPVVQGLHAQATAKKDGALALTGEASARSGSMRWDLVVRPEAAQADGRLDVKSMPLDLISAFLPRVPWHEPQNGRLDASLVVATEPGRAVRFEGQIAMREVALSSPRLAATPVLGIAVALDGHGRLLPLQRRLEVQASTLRIGDVAMQITGAAEQAPDHYVLDVDVAMPQTPCTTAVKAIPEDLLGDMALASWQGKIGGKLTLRLDSRKLQETELDLEPQDHCEFVTVPAMADLRRFSQPFVHFVEEPDGSTFEMETGPGTPAWTYIEDISPFFVHAVLAHEDAGFFTHHGFSLPHVRNALVRDLEAGRYVVGASTITMQLVKNVFLHREKTLARKIQEVLLTWWIERVMEKRDILELYLNVIEFGPGIYGIRNGAKHYFNRLPAQLSPAESVFLATILPNPKRYHGFFEKRALSPQWIEIMKRMLVRLRDRGSYDKESAAYGLSELADFKFVPEGTIVASRIVPGSAAPLPYMRGFGSEEPGVEGGFDDGTWPIDPDAQDDWEQHAPQPPRRPAGPPKAPARGAHP